MEANKTPNDKIKDLQKELNRAIKVEDFERAAEIRDQINYLKNE